jgi:glycoside/pentoside/hexuronide:cation symporter, GPH family
MAGAAPQPAIGRMFALPWIGTAFVLTPVGMLIPAFYASHVGLPLVALGIATALARAIDALADPVVGHLSDRTRGRYGARRPWIAGGAVGLCLSTWLLFRPDTDAGIPGYLLWSVVLYVAIACIDTPLRAWATEITADPLQRTRLFTQSGVARATGSLLFWTMPLVALGVGGSGRLDDPLTLATAAAVLALGLPLLVSLTLAKTPAPPASEPPANRTSFRRFMRDAWSNQPLRVFLAGYGLWSASSGAATAVTFIYLGDHLGLGGMVAPLLAVFFLVQIVAMPWWTRLLGRMEKHRLLAVVWLLDAALKLLLLAFVPGEGVGAGLWLLLVAMAITGSVSYGIPHAVLADIIDLDALRSRQARPASFFALAMLLYKACFGLGASLALVVLGMAGYQMGLQPLAAGVTGTPWSIVLAVIVLPGVLLCAAAAVIARLPLNARRRGVVARRLGQRIARRPAQPRST